MVKIELLDASHDRGDFDCGSLPLNIYLKQTARQHQDRGISRTYVLVQEHSVAPKPVLGFFTINICQLKVETLPAEDAKRLPRDVGGVKLGRLAVAQHGQGRGLGKLLLVASLQKALEIFERVGGIGLFVDAKDAQAAVYYERFGFIPLRTSPLELFLPIKTIREALR